MKRRILLSCIALSAMLSAMAQRHYTFNAVALNVDGLPKKIASIEINPDGKEAAGATTLCNKIANSGWDIVGFSEDFNFHNELTAAPASTYYNFGDHGGSLSLDGVSWRELLSGNVRFNTDGLGLACHKRYSFSGGDRIAWDGFNGTTDQGADGLITKGFRIYTVTIATGVAVDVYVLHMEAEDGAEDIAVRKDQIIKLRDHILKTNKNKRPIIILGDTNCRYTRDELKKEFIDKINADSRFTITDAWVELMWGGAYPAYGSDAMMTHTYGMQKGEIVDKVFYINTTESNLKLKANSYLHDESVNVSEHKPVVVNFTLTDPNGTPVNQELSTPDETVETWADATPTKPTATITGKQFYMRNVNSGLYFKAGSTWGAHFAEGVDGLPVQMTLVSGSTYKISTPTLGRYLGNNYFADNGAEAEGNWIVEEIKSTSSKGGKMTKYIFRNAANNGMAIASSANGYHVDGATYNKTDTKQQWVLYTYDEMVAAIKAEMTATLIGATCDASGLIYQPICNFGLDPRHDKWSMRPAIGGGGAGVNESCVWEVFRDGASHAFDFNQTVNGLPNGTYTVKVQAFFRDGNLWTSSTNVEPVFYAGNKETNICSILDYALSAQPWYADHKNDAGWIPNNMWQANQWFKAGYYTVTLSNVTVNNGTLKIGIKNTSTATSQAWCCFDNFQLYYHGTAQGDLRTSALYKSIKAAADEAIAAVESVNSAEATAAFDISAVAYRYNNNLISADGAWEYAAIDNAVKTAVAAQTTIGANMSLLIENNSFEKGTTEGWTVQGANDTGAKSNTDGTYTTTGIDGNYLFNTWSKDGDECGILHQEITGLRNGYYRLNALVTAWNNRTAYLVGNKQYVGLTTLTDDGKEFKDLALDFLVEDGKANIGAVGDYAGGFNYKKGTFFKVDNFRLTYMGSIGEGRVKIALADAKAKADKLHEGAKNQFYNAVAQYETADVKGDGKTEEAAIYNALKAAIATQPRTETDMTWLIANPGFETGDWTGWNKPTAWEAIVAHATNGVAPGNGEGQYIVNVWNDHSDATNSGVNAPVHQTLKSLPNGRYRLAADVTSDNGNPVAVYATTNSETVNDTIQPTNNGTFKTKFIEFDVTDHTATIGVVGYKDGVNGTFDLKGGCWYKCDNFRLTYLGHELSLDQGNVNAVSINDWYTSVDVTRSITAGMWSTFVVPFNMANPDGWEVKKLDRSEMTGDVISLTFVKADAIEAGVPYMVRKKEGESVSTVSTMNVQVDTKLTTPETNEVQFVGVYEKGTIPVGAFFISDNTFYQAADGTNTIKAFRAYFQPVNNGAKARSLSYRMGDGEDEDDVTTAIDNLDEEVSVVGIYTTGGVRINDMQEGVNILQMSNGSTMKVIIK